MRKEWESKTKQGWWNQADREWLWRELNDWETKIEWCRKREKILAISHLTFTIIYSTPSFCEQTGSRAETLAQNCQHWLPDRRHGYMPNNNKTHSTWETKADTRPAHWCTIQYILFRNMMRDENEVPRWIHKSNCIINSDPKFHRKHS